MPLPKVPNDVSPSPDYRVNTTRREFLGAATVLAANPNGLPAYDDPITDPVIALTAEEKHRRLLALAVRARVEKILFALPKNEWPEEFDDHPIMAEALSLEERADEIFDRIIETPASTLAGIFAKLEWGGRDPDVTEDLWR